jgi:hypothetical protein
MLVYEFVPPALAVPVDSHRRLGHDGGQRAGINVNGVAVAAPGRRNRLDVQSVIPSPQKPAVLMRAHLPGVLIDVDHLDRVVRERNEVKQPKPGGADLARPHRLGAADQRGDAEQAATDVVEGRRMANRRLDPIGVGW